MPVPSHHAQHPDVSTEGRRSLGLDVVGGDEVALTTGNDGRQESVTVHGGRGAKEGDPRRGEGRGGGRAHIPGRVVEDGADGKVGIQVRRLVDAPVEKGIRRESTAAVLLYGGSRTDADTDACPRAVVIEEGTTYAHVEGW